MPTHIDGTRVTGENAPFTTIWVDGFGNDVITDFNRKQGDRSETPVHTVGIVLRPSGYTDPDKPTAARF